jgi:hypothetical protein
MTVPGWRLATISRMAVSGITLPLRRASRASSWLKRDDEVELELWEL